MSTFYASYPVEGPLTAVESLNSLTGALTLVAGSGISITPSGSNITIAATGSGANTALSNLDNPTAINRTALTFAAAGGLASTGGGNGLNLSTPTAVGDMSGSIALVTGGAGGFGDSGDITLTTGPVLGTRGKIKFANGTQGTAGHVWTSIDTAGNGGWAAAASGGANVTLSNLTNPTAINLTALTFAGAGGLASTGGGNGLTLSTPAAPGDMSGSISISTGGTGGFGDSGNISLATGSVLGTRGKIKFQDGTQGTSGDVWTSSDTVGNGYWLTPSFANKTLSNLTSPTAINQNLIFDKASPIFTTKDDTAVTQDLTIKTGDASSTSASGALVLATGSATDASSGAVSISSGVPSAGVASGAASMFTAPTSGAVNSGGLSLYTGAVADATAINSGYLTLGTGASTGALAESGLLSFTTGSSEYNSGAIFISTGQGLVANDAYSGGIFFTTGGVSGTAESGDIKFETGGNADDATKKGDLVLNTYRMMVPAVITAGGTTGNRTINRMGGTVNFATSVVPSTITVTNNLVSTDSLILASIRTDGTGAQILSVVPGAGSFTIKITANSAECAVAFLVVEGYEVS